MLSVAAILYLGLPRFVAPVGPPYCPAPPWDGSSGRLHRRIDGGIKSDPPTSRKNLQNAHGAVHGWQVEVARTGARDSTLPLRQPLFAERKSDRARLHAPRARSRGHGTPPHPEKPSIAQNRAGSRPGFV